MREEIVFAGFGGQGIMLMGKALSCAAMKEGKFVTWMPSYGAEVRGGTAHSMVVISDKEIASPIVREPSICIVMNKPSLLKFEAKVKEKGILLINKSLAEDGSKRNDIEVLDIPATDMASKLGSQRIANMIMLGALLSKKGILPVQALIDSLKDVIPKSRHSMIPLNEKAIREGYEYGSR
ncbi:MAG: 2-oxoacid:acceptor oxidoreductase family protein [Candidatus Gorgyraea atricola]|nr:2-oxoacid:acceptor oxidoreductase family protein [Candidatus Gorgyraea atricola]